ncbi:MAG: MBL fold metallo-hydrolase [Rhodospirillales bacterium]|nr:MBL fold metallo-hydrolase [Alphaproteobacteria bacterium]MBL6947429.1 MBL fold metallo-hydrolase [Rhodospirillales bacterium]
MIFRQLFDSVSCTYTYLLGSRPGGEALLIDPVLEKTERYLQLLDELDLTLVKAVDTHVHADHITALGALRDKTHCVTVMGKMSDVDQVSMRVDDGDKIEIEGLALNVLYTPGHTNDSYSYALPDRVFTGDALFIRGTGRTDFQNGDNADAYHSLFDKLLTLPDETLVYPGHDYKGDTVSTIGEEKAFNPRLQVHSADEYADIMNNLNLPNPKHMDVAVPANLAIGLSAVSPDIQAATIEANDAIKGDMDNSLLVDLREENERVRDGVIPNSVHLPYQALRANIRPGGLLAEMASKSERRILLYCAFGERSALGLQEMFDTGIKNACHLGGGINAWSQAGGTVETLSGPAPQG